MNWFERNLFKMVRIYSVKFPFGFPCCNDFVKYLLFTQKLHKFKYVSVVQVDGMSDIYVHHKLLQDFDFDCFAYGFFPVYSIMCFSKTVLFYIDILDYSYYLNSFK